MKNEDHELIVLSLFFFGRKFPLFAEVRVDDLLKDNGELLILTGLLEYFVGQTPEEQLVDVLLFHLLAEVCLE